MAKVDRFEYERALWDRGCQHVAGVDEVGRGPLAGPVLAAAVILPRPWGKSGIPEPLRGLNDSKQLSEPQRERFFEVLTTHPDIRFGVAQLEAPEIDDLNILKATHAVMKTALAALHPPPDHVLVDGLPVRGMPFPQTALVKGDSRSFSIAAASVIAKVTRDRLMLAHDLTWPHYGFAAHKGYPTPTHLQALAEHGPCPLHRRSFAPLKPRQTNLL